MTMTKMPLTMQLQVQSLSRSYCTETFDCTHNLSLASKHEKSYVYPFKDLKKLVIVNAECRRQPVFAISVPRDGFGKNRVSEPDCDGDNSAQYLFPACMIVMF